MFLKRPTAGLLLLAALACGSDTTRRADHGEVASSLHAPGPPPRPYESFHVPNGGRIDGVVFLDGTPPSDSVVYPTADQPVCGDSLAIPLVEQEDGRLGEAVVWLQDARSGKPLPLERRYELAHDHCRMSPRVLAVLQGGTLNVRSADPVVHRTRFTREGHVEPQRIVLQNDRGQVVPVDDVLAEPGRVRITCDAHPWTRGWILVFDHPYFAVTARDGRFTLDNVPAGRYHLAAWHPRFGLVTRTVEVAGGAATEMEVEF